MALLCKTTNREVESQTQTKEWKERNMSIPLVIRNKQDSSPQSLVILPVMEKHEVKKSCSLN